MAGRYAAGGGEMMTHEVPHSYGVVLQAISRALWVSRGALIAISAHSASVFRSSSLMRRTWLMRVPTTSG